MKPVRVELAHRANYGVRRGNIRESMCTAWNSFLTAGMALTTRRPRLGSPVIVARPSRVIFFGKILKWME